MPPIGDIFRRGRGSGRDTGDDGSGPDAPAKRVASEREGEIAGETANSVVAPGGDAAVALAAAEENSQPDEGRGHRPAAAELLWTDQLGRASLRALQIIIVVLLAGAVIWAGLQLSIVVIPVLLALIVASAARPLIKFLTDHRWPSVLAAVAVLLAVVLVLSGAISLVVVLVSGQWGVLSEKAIDGFNELVGWLNSTFGLVIDGAHLTEWMQQLWDFVSKNGVGATAATGLTAGFSAIAQFLTSFVLFVVVLFFFMKDGPLIWDFSTKPFQGAMRKRIRLMGTRAVEVMGGYIRGTVIVALVDAVFIGIGLAILGVPLAFPLAVIVFISAFIPIVGATLAGVIAALVALVTNGFVAAIWVVVIVVGVNQLEGNFLQPVVLGKSLNLHSLAVLLALTVGTVLGGIIGTLLSVPIAAVGWTLVKSWYQPMSELQREVAEGNKFRKRKTA